MANSHPHAAWNVREAEQGVKKILGAAGSLADIEVVVLLERLGERGLVKLLIADRKTEDAAEGIYGCLSRLRRSRGRKKGDCEEG